MNQTSRKRFLLWQLALVAATALFPVYRWGLNFVNERWLECVLHDRLWLYCPFCGGTRAVGALLCFDFVGAFRANAMVVILIVLLIALEIVAIVRLCRGHERLLPLPGWSWIVLLALILGFAVLRNWLMIAYGIDPTGDLGGIWNG